jgi:hypothetical protein
MKKRTLERLQKSEAGTSEPTALEAVTAFDEALAGLDEGNLSKSEEGKDEEELLKAKKKASHKEPDGDEDEDDEDEDEDEDDAEGDEKGEQEPDGDEENLFEKEKAKEMSRDSKKGKKMVKKSFIDDVADSDPEAAPAMDVEPFLKGLVETIGDRFEALEKSIADIRATQKAQSKVMVAEGSMLKSVLGQDEVTQSQPLPRKSVQTQERFVKSADGSVQLTNGEARAKLIELAKSGKLTPMQVSIIEGRLNKSQELPEYFTVLLKSVN